MNTEQVKCKNPRCGKVFDPKERLADDVNPQIISAVLAQVDYCSAKCYKAAANQRYYAGHVKRRFTKNVLAGLLAMADIAKVGIPFQTRQDQENINRAIAWIRQQGEENEE